MAYHAETHHVSPVSLPAIKRISSDRPWAWMAAGWNDFIRMPGISMTYGLLVTAVMLTAFYWLQSINSFHLAVALMAGFVFLGPVLAVGLYELSRRREHSKPVAISDTWVGWRRNSGSVLATGVVLVLLMMTWFMLSMQMTAVVFEMSGEVVSILGLAADWQSFAFSLHWQILLPFIAIGAVAVAVAYVLTVLAVPMLTDKEDTDVITAMVSSANAVRRNPAAMGLWAVLVALFTGVAVAPLFLGLIVVFPLLAYASWHAYHDLMDQD